jgi:hypothetical protein
MTVPLGALSDGFAWRCVRSAWRWTTGTRPIRGATPHGEMGFYYCDGAGQDSPDCLRPRPLNQMQFGCADCDRRERKPFEAWLDGALAAHVRNAALKRRLAEIKEDPQRFALTRIYCSHGLRVLAHCPGCGKVLDLDDGASPVALVGSVNAGKSVYSAVLASLLRRQDPEGLFLRAGLSCFPRGSAHRTYEAGVVDLLMKEGELPRKTSPDEYHKAVYRLDDLTRARWTSRSIMLTDAAGEVYDEDVTPAVLALRTILLWARGIILLVDPANNGAAGGMGGRQAPDVLEEANRVAAEVVLPTGRIDPPHTGRVLATLEAVTRALHDAQWPNADIGDAAARVAAALASVGIAPGIAPDRIAPALETGRRSRRRTPTNGELADWLAHYLRTSLAGQANGKLPHAVAVAVTKSELIEDEVGPAWREVPCAGSRADAGGWAKELDRISAWSKARLAAMGTLEDQFVATLDQHFTRVGYFFVSSLGRRTELRVRPRGVQMSAGTHDALTEPSAHGAPLSLPGPWWVTSKVVTAGNDRSRCPRPVGVLHPLLWLLCNQT